MKIVFASDAYYPCTHGVAVSIDSSINYLADRGHEIHVIAPEYPFEDKRKLHKNITVHRYKSYSLFFTTNREERFIYPLEMKKIYRTLSFIDPDIIHVNLEFFIGFACKKWAKSNNKVLVMTAHTYYPPYLKLYMPYLPSKICHYIARKCSKWIYDTADWLFTPTKEMKTILVDDYNIKTNVEHLLIGIDEKDFIDYNREKERAENFILYKYPRIRDRKILLFVGRIGEEKNVGFLLYVMEILLRKRRDIELVLVGGGSYIEVFKNKAKELKIEDYVTFIGPIEHSLIRAAFAIGDIFVFPSVTETQGIVTCEALYLGVPVVAVNALGSKSVLDGNKGGFLVEEDKYEFSKKIELLLEDNSLYEKKKLEALERAKYLTFSYTGSVLIERYRRLIKNKYISE